MLGHAVEHLIHNVLPAASDYATAERELTQAYREAHSEQGWESAARTAKRRASELAIAIDGLTDRCTADTGFTKNSIRRAISELCYWPGGTSLRAGAHDRIRAIANAYKHRTLSDPSLPIASEDDILVVGLGFGLEASGVGKWGGVEVLVQEKSGDRKKFIGDAPVVIGAWFRFLAAQGVTLPSRPIFVCNLQVHPVVAIR